MIRKNWPWGRPMQRQWPAFGECRELSCTQDSTALLAGHRKANPYLSIWVVLLTVPTRMVGVTES